MKLLLFGFCFLAFPPHAFSGFNGDGPTPCVDAHGMCCFWASCGECDKNCAFMKTVCAESCGTCGCTPETADTCPTKVNSNCQGGMGGGMSGGVNAGTGGGMGGNQQQQQPNPPPPPPPTQPPPPTAAQPAPAPTPAPTQAPAPAPAPAPSPSPSENATPAPTGGGGGGGCKDTHDYCCFWASTGECDRNKYFMRVVCQKSCGTCGCSLEKAQGCSTKVDVQGCKWI